MLKYRPDIDGLRALAVLPVVLFHADIPGFSGGFVGVDIFFVISGFLITSLLLTELQDNTFSLRRFYIRRARRLFPALVAMVAVTLLAGFFLLLPQALSETARAARRIAVFFSNHLFWSQSQDYWLQNTLSGQPLLHTWSLAVEEQFYLLIPGLLLICFWLGKKQGKFFSLVLLSGLLLISLIVSQWLLGKDPSAAFYLLPSRAWELLSGALLVFIVQRKQPIQLHPFILQLVGTLGFALIGYSVFFYSKEIPFPGLAALFPCLGAVLIIYTGSQSQISWVNHLLKKPLLVFIGLISYSLYLWHWPILVLYRSPNWMAYNLPDIPVWLLLGVTLFISWISWRWIEQPFRKQQVSKQNLSEWRQLIMGFIALSLCWGAGKAASSRTAEKFQPTPYIFKEAFSIGMNCAEVQEVALIKSGKTNCILGNPSTEPSFFIIGDSHAMMWTPGLDLLAKEHNLQGIALAYSACTPIWKFEHPDRKHCSEITDATLEYIVSSPIKNIVLSGYWFMAMEKLDNTINPSIFYEKLSAVLEKLSIADKTVYFMHDVPELKNPSNKSFILKKILESHHNPGKNIYIEIPNSQVIEHKQFVLQIENLQQKYFFMTLDPFQMMLDKENKMLIVEKLKPTYYDGDHLSNFGSLHFREVFLPLMKNMALQ